MFKTKCGKGCLLLLSIFFLLSYALEMEAFARAGGGRSFGSRGSRSYMSPSRPAPSSPSYSQQQQPMRQPAGGGWRNMGGAILGGLAGGLLGGMLFRSLGFAGGGFGTGGGIGLIDIILIGLILYAIYWFMSRKRRARAIPDPSYREAAPEPLQPGNSSTPFYAQPNSGNDLEQGLGYIRQMDHNFDTKTFQDACMDIFFKIQGAWMNRELSGVRDLFTEDIYRTFTEDVDRLKKEKMINRLENIAVRSVDITEVWQEEGQDFITVKFYANLLDYTTDETGQVLSGSKTDPVKFEEYWTFTRPVGANPWRLTAITQAQS